MWLRLCCSLRCATNSYFLECLLFVDNYYGLQILIVVFFPISVVYVISFC